MSSALPSQNESLRHRLRKRLDKLRHRSRDPSDHASANSPPTIGADPDLVISGELTTTSGDEAQIQTVQSALHASSLEQSSIERSTLDDDIGSAVVSSDLWSAAYLEAVNSLGEDIDVAIFKGRNVAQMFRELEEIDKEAMQESAFLRGVSYLHSIQVPLERFKLALDLASPLTSLEPTATTVFGVVRSVTAVSFFLRDITPCTPARTGTSLLLTRDCIDCHQLCNC